MRSRVHVGGTALDRKRDNPPSERHSTYKNYLRQRLGDSSEYNDHMVPHSWSLGTRKEDRDGKGHTVQGVGKCETFLFIPLLLCL